MHKVVIVDGQNTIESYCKEAVASLVDDSAFQSEDVSTVSITVREGPMQNESIFDVVIRKRTTGYAVTVGPPGESPMIRYFFHDEEIAKFNVLP